MARAFNIREGFTAADDRMLDRYFEPFTSGPLEGVAQDREIFKKAKEIYYQVAGWDKDTGKPTEAKYVDLGLEWLAEKMAGK